MQREQNESVGWQDFTYISRTNGKATELGTSVPLLSCVHGCHAISRVKAEVPKCRSLRS